MIRSNWSLAKEVRQHESKQKQKIQQRQKHQHMLDKLTKIDPIRLYFQIEKLEGDKSDEKRLKSLQEDWKFIRKHKLHEKKLSEFLEQQKQKKEKRERAQNKLWGKQSIYFNPELNPLGKVPRDSQGKPFSNLTIPLKKKTKFPSDPLIEQLGVTLPEGEPPQFYKKPQNITIDKKPNESNTEEKKGSKPKADIPRHTALDTDSENGEGFSSEDELPTKKLRME
ncbi:hypothetical protein CJI97_003792 [Candidozyma auris]|uniref:hypothetical_protein n=1 Tax=Candidozyma auris TaxID=498019 RepID=UPI000C3A1A42|nr:hypothetical_protein [[Candida] auris]PIS54094.1 hypothetical protein CJI97_003792 [[Candida] auris]QEO21407.1 hypothetical_protein [[Candida] auris]GBL48090.1 hypothetical protein CAJCM15448_03640 [[Candida] auris]